MGVGGDVGRAERGLGGSGGWGGRVDNGLGLSICLIPLLGACKTREWLLHIA